MRKIRLIWIAIALAGCLLAGSAWGGDGDSDADFGGEFEGDFEGGSDFGDDFDVGGDADGSIGEDFNSSDDYAGHFDSDYAGNFDQEDDSDQDRAFGSDFENAIDQNGDFEGGFDPEDTIGQEVFEQELDQSDAFDQGNTLTQQEANELADGPDHAEEFVPGNDFDQTDSLDPTTHSSLDNDADFMIESPPDETFIQEDSASLDEHSARMTEAGVDNESALKNEGSDRELTGLDHNQDDHTPAQHIPPSNPAERNHSLETGQAHQDNESAQNDRTSQDDEATQDHMPFEKEALTGSDTSPQPTGSAANDSSAHEEKFSQPAQTDQAAVTVQENTQSIAAVQGDTSTQSINIQNVQTVQNSSHDHNVGHRHDNWHDHHHHGHHHHHGFDIGFGLGLGLGSGLGYFDPFLPFGGFGYYGFGGFAPFSSFVVYRNFSPFSGAGYYGGYVPLRRAGFFNSHFGFGPYSHFGEYYLSGGMPAMVATAPILALPVMITPSRKPVYIQQRNATRPPSANKNHYWHYCRNPEGYYPYVRKCPDGWLKVPPRPS